MTIKQMHKAAKMPALEIKALSNQQEVGQAFGEFMQAFEGFKQAMSRKRRWISMF
jgi:alkylhydroperoxidase/carboxymuconolactone decarboxylase family protein YurZ